jgi:hypothetical protein
MPAIELVDMMKVLRIERSHTRTELRKLEKAVSALRELSANAKATGNGRSRRMPASARRKIAAAQRKRWAKFHQKRG